MHLEARGRMSGTRLTDDAAGLAALASCLTSGLADPLSDACALAASMLGASGCALYADDAGTCLYRQSAAKASHSLSLSLSGTAGRVVFSFAETPEDEATLRRRAEAVASLLGLGLARGELARLFRQVERAKREWEATFDTIAEGVAILDTDCRIVRANWAFARMLGTTPREVVGKLCHDLIGDPAACAGCRAAAPPHDDAATRFVREVNLDHRYLSVSVYPFLNDQKQEVGSVHVLRDVTEERQLHETVVRTERLRALGEMATGVAHSFGNLLVSIGGWAEVLAAEPDERVQRPANAILQASRDGAEAVFRLQNYARSQDGVPFVLVDVNEVVRDALELSQPRYRPLAVREGISFEVAVDLRPVPAVNGSPAELREVLVNLIFNAVDAMPAGGTLTVSTAVNAREVAIAVRDSGTGMTAEVQQHIFDPFFTTKGQGGSGLGLAIAAGIVERHGGRIAVESAPGLGSTFTVIIPAVAKGHARRTRAES
jgi:PAS domain S-box-containing protein